MGFQYIFSNTLLLLSSNQQCTIQITIFDSEFRVLIPIMNNYLLSIIVLFILCGFVEVHSNNLCIETRAINIPLYLLLGYSKYK